uniref:Uncharacterized protein n=1 Tax=Avena sativa TaxID=4498 RepID=A0ACD5VWH7_AVESA
MADEWWSASQRSHGTSACSAAPLMDTGHAAACGWTSPVAESSSSITFQDPRRSGNTSHQPSSDAVSSLGDPHMDWTHAFLSGRSDASFQAVLQDDMAASTTTRPLFRAHQPAAAETVMNNNPFTDMGHGLGFLDQLPAASSSPSPYGTAPSQGMFDNSAAAHNVSMFGESQPSVSYDASAAGMQMQGGGAQLQCLPGSGSYMPFGGAALPSQLLLQAVQPKTCYSSNSNNLMVKSAEHGACPPAGRKAESDSPAAAKRPRIEAPSPLPTFKVRKEKLGDRITALQQLVSPFGKVLVLCSESTPYISFLTVQLSERTSALVALNSSEIDNDLTYRWYHPSHSI